MQLGLISLQQSDPVRLAHAADCRAGAQAGPHGGAGGVGQPRADHRAHRGRAVGRAREHAPRHGDELRGTASGRLFAAHLPPAVVRPVYEAERRLASASRRANGAAATAPLAAWPAFERELADVRRHRLGRAEGAVIAGVSALSAPVFDHRGTMVLAITAIGPSAAFDARWTGAIAVALREAAAAVSARLGHRNGATAAGAV